jgi:hypothetical protein
LTHRALADVALRVFCRVTGAVRLAPESLDVLAFDVLAANGAAFAEPLLVAVGMIRTAFVFDVLSINETAARRAAQTESLLMAVGMIQLAVVLSILTFNGIAARGAAKTIRVPVPTESLDVISRDPPTTPGTDTFTAHCQFLVVRYSFLVTRY